MDLEFAAEIIEWRGPAPFYFVPVPDEESAEIEAASQMVSYGWGVIPVTVHIGDTRFETSLFPKEGRYLVPLKVAVRRAEALEEGDTVAVRLLIDA
jgi:hypothetical protein